MNTKAMKKELAVRTSVKAGGVCFYCSANHNASPLFGRPAMRPWLYARRRGELPLAAAILEHVIRST